MMVLLSSKFSSNFHFFPLISVWLYYLLTFNPHFKHLIVSGRFWRSLKKIFSRKGRLWYVRNQELLEGIVTECEEDEYDDNDGDEHSLLIERIRVQNMDLRFERDSYLYFADKALANSAFLFSLKLLKFSSIKACENPYLLNRILLLGVYLSILTFLLEKCQNFNPLAVFMLTRFQVSLWKISNIEKLGKIFSLLT